MKFKSTLSLIIGLVVLCTSSAAFADPPSRVGRVSYAEGDVATHTPDQDDWYSATINVPVTSGDAFWTERNARLEIQIAGAVIRLDHNTELDVTQLDDEGTVLEVPEGVINIHVRYMTDEGIVVLTPQGETELTRPGTYHIDTGHPRGRRPADRDYITVLDGRARFRTERNSVVIRGGDTAVAAGYLPSISIEEADTDAFDDWAERRDRRYRVTHSHRYVSPMVIGYEDLDSYGHWDRDPRYGRIWYPDYIPADWAPYRYGHWAYISPWGWTWVDDQPWGFAPFHYGRWIHYRHRWAWYPGVVEERPVYAPALVAFIGGRNFGISLSLGNSQPVGWVPLAPNEPFHPYYHVSDRYRVAVNRTTVNQTIINNVVINNRTVVNNYGNATTSTSFANRDAATVIPATAFVKGTHVKNSSVQISDKTMAQVTVAPPETIANLQPTVEAKAGGESKPGRGAQQAKRPDTRGVARERMREVREQRRAERAAERKQRKNKDSENVTDPVQNIQPAAPSNSNTQSNTLPTDSTPDVSAKKPADTPSETGAPIQESPEIQSDKQYEERRHGRRGSSRGEIVNPDASPVEPSADSSNPEDTPKGPSMDERRDRRLERTHGRHPDFDREAPSDNSESTSADNVGTANMQPSGEENSGIRGRGPHEVRENDRSKPNKVEFASPNGNQETGQEPQTKSAAPQATNQPLPPQTDANGGGTLEEKIDHRKGRENKDDASNDQRTEGRGRGQVQEESIDNQKDNKKRLSNRKHSVEEVPEIEVPEVDSQDPSSNPPAQ